MKNESWFIERIGKYIIAESSSYNGMMLIKDEHHALYLCHTSQKYFNYKFSEMNPQPFDKSNREHEAEVSDTTGDE